MRARAAALLLAGALRGVAAVAQLSGEERVDLALPESVLFQVTDLAAKGAPVTTPLAFRRVLLLPGRALRISARAEVAGSAGEAPAISFATTRARGGTGSWGRLRSGDYTPVFESAPLAAWGDVEIAWRLESAGKVERAGPHTVTLRWKVESVPVAGWTEDRAGREDRPDLPGAGRAESPGADLPRPRFPGPCPGASPRPPAPP